MKGCRAGEEEVCGWAQVTGVRSEEETGRQVNGAGSELPVTRGALLAPGKTVRT